MELSKTFDSKAAEERWFQLWIDRGYFAADPDKVGDAFSIVIPPPNVTGQLHLGHALNVTLQDIIVRTRRMQGYNTLWVPGTDHAGIATQNAVEKDLAKEGKNRHQLGRDKFEQRVWEWRDTYGNRILNQLRRLGASCDWSRERFTLDEGLSRAVNEVFIQLYRKGLIYKDRKLINWCPRCETALSDLEVDHKEQKNGTLWYIKYPLVDGSGYIEVATTRPETMLGDTAVAVNPEDDRYRAMVGKMVRVPLIGREIPIIADAAVDSAFGTGAVKVTPGHDFNDFEMGRRHHLEEISVMDTRARMNANAGPYAGLEREAARKRVLADLKSAGLYEKEEKHTNNIGTCSRCDTVVEPMLSEQWFLNVKPMAEKAIAAVKDGRTKFFPKFWENTFFNWMENIHDWCISRQLWWGHRIPVYRCQRCDHVMVTAVRPLNCEECEGTDLKQEDDVLDTWFSSGLWPFSTLGWPEQTKDLARYYPTSLLVTGFDIIFFWVARMMMFGLEFTGDVPFRDIYITPLVRDAEGKKMSKSKGNVVDPLELMDTYGTDALRFTLAQLAIQGRDVILSPERLAASRAFANKIWNAARYVIILGFDQMLRLLHPFMPFVSEEIWSVIRPYIDDADLAPNLPIAKFPVARDQYALSDAELLAMNHCIEATEAVNSLRALVGHHPGQRIRAFIKRLSADDRKHFSLWSDYAKALGKIDAFESTDQFPQGSVAVPLQWCDLAIEPPAEFDFGKATQKLRKELDEVGKHAAQHEKRLNDQNFMAKADPETRIDVEQRFVELKSRKQRLEQQIEQLGASAQ